MLRVPITDARPGMSLAVSIHHPQRADQTLLRAGYRLDQPTINRLADFRIREIWIAYPSLDFIGKYVNPRLLRAQAVLTKTIGDVLQGASGEAHPTLDYASYRRMMRDFINTILECPSAAVMLQELASTHDALLRHSTNVCYLSLLMGLKLEGYLMTQRRRLSPSHAKDIVNLGVGAMLHDIGMTRLDPATIERWEGAHDEQDAEWREHVRFGYDMTHGIIAPTAAAAVLHHHQRFDGRGFPERDTLEGVRRGLCGDEIHIFARIIAAADLFDRLRRPTSDDEPVPVVCALSAMRQLPLSRAIDPVTFRALISVAPPYPPGGLVTLSNGVRGVVTTWSCQDPCRPVVQEVGELDHNAADDLDTPLVLDLREHRDVHIAQAEGQDVARHNFDPARPDEFDIHLYERTLM